MELPGIALGIAAVVIVDTVCYIGCLLYFKHKVSTAYAVDTSCRKKKHIGRLGKILAERRYDFVFSHLASVLGHIELAGKTGV